MPENNENLPEESEASLTEAPVQSGTSIFKGRTTTQIISSVQDMIEKKGKGKDAAKVGLMLMVLDEVKETKKFLDSQRKDGRGKRVNVDLTSQTRRWLTSVQFLYDSLNDLDLVHRLNHAI